MILLLAHCLSTAPEKPSGASGPDVQTWYFRELMAICSLNPPIIRCCTETLLGWHLTRNVWRPYGQAQRDKVLMVTDFLEKVEFELMQSLKITTGNDSGQMVRQSCTTIYLYLQNLYSHPTMKPHSVLCQAAQIINNWFSSLLSNELVTVKQAFWIPQLWFFIEDVLINISLIQAKYLRYI